MRNSGVISEWDAEKHGEGGFVADLSGIAPDFSAKSVFLGVPARSQFAPPPWNLAWAFLNYDWSFANCIGAT
jgi:hypothetical protein